MKKKHVKNPYHLPETRDSQRFRVAAIFCSIVAVALAVFAIVYQMLENQ